MTIRHALGTAATLLCIGSLAACQPQGEQATADAPAATDVALETDAQKFGYAIGVDLGRSLKPVADDVDVAALKAGIDDMLAGTEPRLDDEAREQVKQTVAQKIQQKQMEQRVEKAKASRAEGEQFLAENAKRDGGKVTDSGLQYEELEAGDGAKPSADDKVKVHYRGTLIDGTEFDSSYKRGQPISFPLKGVIKGWTEGVQLMPVGSKYKLYIPSDLAYGESGSPPRIGPNETLIFEIELVAIEGEDEK